jgi:hypothetical protein
MSTLPPSRLVTRMQTPANLPTCAVFPPFASPSRFSPPDSSPDPYMQPPRPSRTIATSLILPRLPSRRTCGTSRCTPVTSQPWVATRAGLYRIDAGALWTGPHRDGTGLHGAHRCFRIGLGRRVGRTPSPAIRRDVSGSGTSHSSSSGGPCSELRRHHLRRRPGRILGAERRPHHPAKT